MKKNLFLAAAALAVIAGCAKSTVVDVADNRAIEFDQFVGNNTKAVSEVNGLTGFYAFGYYSDKGTYDAPVFENVLSTETRYWVADKDYSFGGYTDGLAGGAPVRIDGDIFNPETGVFTFKDYQADDAKDLVVATVKMHSAADNTTNGPVSLTFKHMLSQVKFTFTTTDDPQYNIAISALKINTAATQGTGTYTPAADTDTEPTISWVPSETELGGYTYDAIPNIEAGTDGNRKTESDSKLVIPQSASLTVSFTARITDNAGLDKSREFSIELPVAAYAEWQPGYRYNYTAEINGDKIIDKNAVIEFTPSVSDWMDADSVSTTPVAE